MKGGETKMFAIKLKSLVIALMALSVFAIMAVNAFAKTDGSTRPGWGYGDKNHVHTGPPGQSVRP